ncbi:hypothetical protein Golob_004615 [Gossypium lobatum]|uniref:Uncharacterized protein n=1 Tax=Gossypium lobatum TaxID=34289 RepID=A0A7J8N258_9ROSI|nr:hypothetical protein [Gossypium lobatum]
MNILIVIKCHVSLPHGLTHFVLYSANPDDQVVWIQLLGLPKGYYSECLLCAIGQKIGPVIKLDEYTDNARRGKFTRLANLWPELCPGQQVPMSGGDNTYVATEGVICYVALMIVERRQKGKGQSLGTVVGEKHCNRTGGSRFSVLDELRHVVSKNGSFQRKQTVKAKGKGVIVGSGPRIGLKVIGHNNAAGRAPSTARLGSFDDRLHMGLQKSIGQEKDLIVQPVSVRSILDKEKHAVVHSVTVILR